MFANLYMKFSCTHTHIHEHTEMNVFYSLHHHLSCSPLNLQGSIRHSSSSLSSHTSSEAGNLVIMTDGLMGEHPEEALHMQVRLVLHIIKRRMIFRMKDII